jgi:drug/metabolite transporter (DMT)-like permease
MAVVRAGRPASRAWIGYGMVVLAATLWGINGSLMRALLDGGLDDTRLSAVRLTGTAAILLAWVAWRNPRYLRLDRREVAAYAAFGVLGLVMVQWLYVIAVARMDVALVLVIEYIAPLLVTVWAVAVWREHVPRLVWLLTVVALAGLAAAVGVGGENLDSLSGVGVACALAAAVAYAYYAVHAERLVRVRPGPVVVALGMGFGAVFWAIAAPWWSFPVEALTGDVDLGGNVDAAIPGWLALVLVVVVGTVVPFCLMLAGVGRVRATGATVTAMLEPVVAGAVAWLWLDQRLTALQVAGGIVVIGAVLGVQLVRARASRGS